MDEKKFPAIRRVAGLPQKREETVAILSECYSRDIFELDEYEHRIELVHAAATLDDLEALLSDVPADVLAVVKKNPSLPVVTDTEILHLKSSFGSQKVCDPRLVAGRVKISLKGGTIHLDYRSIDGLPREIIIDAELKYSTLKIFLPPSVGVIDELENKGSTIKNKRHKRYAGVPFTHTIRLRGTAAWSSVKIKTGT
jgi:hypothetical protein